MRFRTSALQVADMCLVEGLMLVECGQQPFLRSTEFLNHTGLGQESWVGASSIITALGGLPITSHPLSHSLNKL